jgi:hypothetical protein
VKTVFIRALDPADRELRLRAASERSDRARVVLDIADFARVPGSPFAYWVPAAVRTVFDELRPFESEAAGRTTRCGLGTLDDWRFLRQRWEVSPTSHSHVPYVSGGTFNRFYESMSLLVAWSENGREVKSYVEQKVGSASRKVQGEDHYFTPGFVFPRRTRALAPKVMPRGCIYSTGGQAGFAPTSELLGIIAALSSAVVSYLVAASQGSTQAPQFEVGLVKRVPFPDLTPADEAALAKLAHRAWSLKRSLDTRTETSHAFVLPALLQVDGATLAERALAWESRVCSVEGELAAIQADIDERCFELYGIGEEDRRSITEGFGGSPAVAEEGSEEADTEAEDEEEEEAETADTATLVAELVSWAVGAAFGRFDVRLATGDQELPGEPEPFDPLPVCSPGMLTGADGLPLAVPPAGYALSFPVDGILVDDPGHPLDLVAAVRAVFDVVFGPSADARWQEAAALLDPKGHDLRTWFRSSFFEYHLRRHSKSRRKAPIFWQLGVPSGRYAAWTYAHRLTPDSLFALSRDLVAPKLALEERRRTSLVQDAGPNPTAKQRTEISAQDTIVEELRAFAEEVRRVTPLWNPDLDDGIVLVSAPLWRLVPHKPWQKELRSRWDDLTDGKYDWAHFAMHLWPERVVPNCAIDRSLAIAHGLEDVFWVEGAGGKWTRRSHPTTSIDDLIADRTKPAIKAALAELLAAPAPAGARTRGRAGE